VSPEARAVLLRVAAAMVPTAGGLPSAGAEETLGVWLDSAARRRPVLLAELAELGERGIADGDAAVIELVRGGGASTFSAIVLEAWFRHPKVRERFDYAGVTPMGAFADEEAMRALGAAVLDRAAPAGTTAERSADLAAASRGGGAQ
jgi:hypothetical protein